MKEILDMADISRFESREGNLQCTPEALFRFVTDLRNFGQFVPGDSVTEWVADADNCSFRVGMIGVVSVRITEREPVTRVVFNGDALKKNDFSLTVDINKSPEDKSIVRLLLEAELNPMLKMVAAKPVSQFLELLVSRMETFGDWSRTVS